VIRYAAATPSTHAASGLVVLPDRISHDAVPKQAAACMILNSMRGL
jgi:hypothetical protein